MKDSFRRVESIFRKVEGVSERGNCSPGGGAVRAQLTGV